MRKKALIPSTRFSASWLITICVLCALKMRIINESMFRGSLREYTMCNNTKTKQFSPEFALPYPFCAVELSHFILLSCCCIKKWVWGYTHEILCNEHIHTQRDNSLKRKLWMNSWQSTIRGVIPEFRLLFWCYFFFFVLNDHYLSLLDNEFNVVGNTLNLVGRRGNKRRGSWSQLLKLRDG